MKKYIAKMWAWPKKIFQVCSTYLGRDAIKQYATKMWAWLKKIFEKSILKNLIPFCRDPVIIIVIGILLWFGFQARSGIVVTLKDGEDFLTYVGSGLFATISLYLLYLRAKAQDKLAEAQITTEANERFSRAIEQIGDSKGIQGSGGNLLPNIQVRLGGLYTLEQLAKELPEIYHNTTLSVLCAYVRENTPKIGTTTTGQTALKKPREDAQTALTIIGRHTVLDNEPSINLSHLTLTGADLYRADLRDANLEGADLQKAILREADLQKAILREADLQKAILWNAYLQGAYLQGADLQKAILWKADLQTAKLHRANLKKAMLWEADLREATLVLAELQGADLEEANLQGADLQGASLQGANLKSSNISKEQLQLAYVDENTTFPDGKKYAHKELKDKGMKLLP